MLVRVQLEMWLAPIVVCEYLLLLTFAKAPVGVRDSASWVQLAMGKDRRQLLRPSEFRQKDLALLHDVDLTLFEQRIRLLDRGHRVTSDLVLLCVRELTRVRCLRWFYSAW